MTARVDNTVLLPTSKVSSYVRPHVEKGRGEREAMCGCSSNCPVPERTGRSTNSDENARPTPFSAFLFS